MATPSEIQRGVSLLRNGHIREAANIYEALIRENPKDASAWHYLGVTCMQRGDLPRAEQLLRRSLELDPCDANTLSDFGAVKAGLKQYEPAIALFSRALAFNDTHTDALNNLAAALNTLRRPQEALPHLERLSTLQPDCTKTICKLAQTRLKLGDTDRVISGLRQAIKLEPGLARARNLLGEALETVGRFKQAQLQYLNVLRRDADNVIALARLLQLPEGEIESEWLEKAHALLKNTQRTEDQRIRLHIALGHYYDRRGAYDDAFENFRLGYDLQFARAPFNSEGYRRAVDSLIRTCTPALFSAAARQDVKSDRPIFIVGMPRSGTTLMEQILASHSRVAAGGELSTIMSIGSQLHHLDSSYRPYPEGLCDLKTLELARMGQRYLEKLDRVSSTADRVTDKQPFNFMHLGLIAVLFPGAKIIHCRRDPLDTCLSCYFVSFADEFQFASDLRTLGNYYLDYQRLMEHWHRVLPVPILDVRYEELVSDTEKMVGRVLDHCGLAWEESCLRFYETKRAVRTPSRWQVRQPIYSRSIGRWKKYERHLEPLKTILSPIIGSAHVAES